jgi:hypothetical protein
MLKHIRRARYKMGRKGWPVSRNHLKILKLKNRHAGNRCFLIGMGPSLKIEDLECLIGEKSFACNKIYLSYDKTNWRPDYYSVIDVAVAEQNRENIIQNNGIKIFDSTLRPYFKDQKNIIWISGSRQSETVNIEKFDPDPFMGFYRGYTVLYFQMQLAWYMGFREIYLLGLDFNFVLPNDKGGYSSQGELLKNKNEVNHFHPDYRKPGELWTIPNMEGQKRAFMAAKEYAQNHGGKIINCSPGSKLDVFPKMNLNEAI